MADPGDTYNNSPGFTDTGNGVVADPTTVGSDTDYKSWDWKQIMAAITGSAATTDSAQGAGVADPSSLSQAAQQLLHVQRTLEMIGKNLGEQRDALTKNGAWKGDAADSFSTAIDSFMADVRSQAEALGGSSKGWGSTSVPNQLQKNSVELSTAQQRIHEIDAWYAHQAQLAGVQPMSNGLIPVSQKPEIVTMLNNSMREVIDDLAGRYKVTANAAVPPTPGDTQLGGGTPPPNYTPPPTYTPPPPTDAPPPPQTFGGGPGGGPGTGPPDLGGGPGAGPGSGGPGAPDLKAIDPYSGPTGLGDGGGGLGGGGLGGGLGDGGPGAGGLGAGGGAGAAAFTPAAFNGPTGLGDVPSGLGADNAGMDSALNPGGGAAPLPFPGGAGLGGGAGTGAALGGAGTGAGLDPTLTSASPFADPGLGDAPAGLGDGAGGAGGAPAPFPGSTGLGDGAGLGGAGGADGLGGAAAPFPGSTGLGDGAGGLGGAVDPAAFPGGTGLGGGSGLPGSLSANMPEAPSLGAVGSAGGGAGTGGAGMPMMPPMGGMGAGAGAGGKGGEPSDASGLISRTPQPFAGDTSLGDPGDLVSGADAGTPGLAALDTPLGGGVPTGLPGLDGTPDLGAVGAAGGGAGAGGAGMPMMPPMGGMGAGAGAGGKGVESPDAAGLVARAPEPFAGDTSLGDPGAMVPGAGPAPEAFAMPDGGLGAVGSAGGAGTGGAGAGGAGMPMMPPMGGMGAGAGGKGVESPDAAGLVARAPEPFAGDTSLGDPGAMASGTGVPAALPDVGSAPDAGAGLGQVPAGELAPDLGAVGSSGGTAPAGGAGMPMVPPMGGTGAGAGAGGKGVESPDAAGLLARSPDGFAEPIATAGQPVGGAPGAGAPWFPLAPGARGERDTEPERPESAELLEGGENDFGAAPSSAVATGPATAPPVAVTTPEPPDDGSAWEIGADDDAAWWSEPGTAVAPSPVTAQVGESPTGSPWARWAPEHTPAPPPPPSLSCADVPEPEVGTGPDEDVVETAETPEEEAPRSASDLLTRSAAWWDDPSAGTPAVTPARATSSVWG